MNNYNTYSKYEVYKKSQRTQGKETKQFKGLKAEEYVELGGRYAITISPEDKRDTIKDTFNDYTDIREHIREVHATNMELIFSKLRFCDIEVWPELSPTGRLHYHGVITVIDTIGFLWNDVQHIRENAVCEIDTISDMEKWITYCKKQQHLTDFYFDINTKPLRIQNRRNENKKE